jgi:phospholipase C
VSATGQSDAARRAGTTSGRDARAYTRRQVLAGGLGAAGAALLAACGSPAVRRAAATPPAGSDLGAVEHLVFLMQENRSFDHYFGAYRGVRGFDDRSDGALATFEQAWPGTGHAPVLLPFPLGSAAAQLCAGNAAVPTHDWAPQHLSWADGTNRAFVSVHAEPAYDGPALAPLVMGYYDRQALPYYYALADAFTICDGYFCSVLGPTMPNRMYWLSGTLDPAGHHGGPILETPGLSGPGSAAEVIGTCSWTTMPEVLEDAGISWKVYQPPGTATGAGRSIALATGFNNLLYFRQFVSDPASPLATKAFTPTYPDDFTADVAAGTLPAVSWVLPPLAYSEHPNSSPAAGQWFTSRLLTTLWSNPELWSKTVVVLSYDENGGFFDHVVPPTPPVGTAGETVTVSPLPADAEGVGGVVGLGFRVPCLVISPFSRGGFVDSTVLDHTSQLRLIEARFSVTAPNLSAWRRRTVGDLTSALSFTRSTTTTPSLPATSLDLPAGCPTDTPAGLLDFLHAPEPVVVPSHQQLPTQEPGAARRRPPTR